MLALLAATLLVPSTVKGIPALQLYIEGAYYDDATESWSASGGNTIRLWTIGNLKGPGGVGGILGVKLAVAYNIADTAQITINPTTTGGFQGFTDTSVPSAPVYLQTRTDGSTPLLFDGQPLPSHGEYGKGTAWQEFALGDFTKADSPIADFNSNTIVGIPGSLAQINAYEITFSGTENIHFDLYNHVQSINKGRGKKTFTTAKITTVFAPFSHDAHATGVPDGGTTAVLMGIGVLGLALLKLSKSS